MLLFSLLSSILVPLSIGLEFETAIDQRGAWKQIATDQRSKELVLISSLFSNGGVFMLSNNQLSTCEIPNQAQRNWHRLFVSKDSNTIVAVENNCYEYVVDNVKYRGNGFIFVSVSGGISWTQSNAASNCWNSIAGDFTGKNLFATRSSGCYGISDTDGGVYVFSDYEVNWTEVPYFVQLKNLPLNKGSTFSWQYLVCASGCTSIYLMDICGNIGNQEIMQNHLLFLNRWPLLRALLKFLCVLLTLVPWHWPFTRMQFIAQKTVVEYGQRPLFLLQIISLQLLVINLVSIMVNFAYGALYFSQDYGQTFKVFNTPFPVTFSTVLPDPQLNYAYVGMSGGAVVKARVSDLKALKGVPSFEKAAQTISR
jgi:hypothetical protein